MTGNGITRVERILNLLKGLSFGNVLVIFILVMTATAIYIVYRFLNDEALMDKFLSHYEEISAESIPCTLRIGGVRKGSTMYSITTGFAYEGNDRWIVGVHRNSEIKDNEFLKYCEMLQAIVEYLRRPDAPSPNEGPVQ